MDICKDINLDVVVDVYTKVGRKKRDIYIYIKN